MRISKWMHRALAAALVLTLFAAALAAGPTKAQAAKVIKKNITLYQGERDVFYDAGAMVTKVSSSNKKIVTAKEKDAMSFHVILSAKKAGKATVTVKASKGTKQTHKLSITVKKPKFDTDLILTEGGIVFTSVNRMPQYFDAEVTCTLRDAEGNELWQKTRSLRQLPDKTSYAYYGQSKKLLEKIDPEQSTVEVTSFHRYQQGVETTPCDLRYVYKDVSDKVKSSMKVKVTPDENEFLPRDVFEIKLKNPSSHQMSPDVFILFYDEEDNLLRIGHVVFYSLYKKGETTTKTIDVSPQYDHYEIVVNAYVKYKK